MPDRHRLIPEKKGPSGRSPAGPRVSAVALRKSAFVFSGRVKQELCQWMCAENASVTGGLPPGRGGLPLPDIRRRGNLPPAPQASTLSRKTKTAARYPPGSNGWPPARSATRRASCHNARTRLRRAPGRRPLPSQSVPWPAMSAPPALYQGRSRNGHRTLGRDNACPITFTILVYSLKAQKFSRLRSRQTPVLRTASCEV